MTKVSIIFIALLMLSGCSDMCANTIVTSAASPDALHSAILFQRDCGATTGFSTQVSVLQPADKLSTGNAFRADDDHGAAAVGSWGGPWAEIRWIAKDHLLIRYAVKSRLFKQADDVAGVRVSYQQVPG